MRRRHLLLFVVAALLGSSCGGVGVGLPGCQTPTANPTEATLLALQAVPTADYAPCLNSLKLGWDEVDFEVESGLARIEVGREFSSFLEVRLTESCDIGDASEVPSDVDDVRRYENITAVGSEIRVTLIPTGERPRIHALSLAQDLAGARIDGRAVVFSVDEDIDFSTRTRVNAALFTDQFVWIINDLDIEEETLELRRTIGGEGARGLSVHEAMDRIEDMTPEVSYQGQWYLVFNGGCITYDFDAEGTVATTVAEDAAQAIGLYPNAELREVGRNAGYEILEE